MLADDLEAARYPPVSLPASAFGPPAGGSNPGEPWADLADLPRRGRLDLICLRPIHHVLEYEELYRLTSALRARAPELVLHLFLRSALRDPSPFALLPVDRVARLDAGGGRGALAAGLRRLAGERDPRAAAVVLAPPAGRRQTRIVLPGGGAAWSAPLGFRTAGCRGCSRCGAASASFLAAVCRESPLWRTAGSAPPPLSRRLAGRRFLVHQARFHIGDTLWLTPLLRALHANYLRPRVTLVVPPAAAILLAGNPHVSDLLCYEPRDGEEARGRVLAALAGRRFDAALLAFTRRHESAWLAQALAAAGVPRRINLEYHDPFLDSRRPWELATHEGWFFWGALPSPRLLLHALDPLLAAGASGGRRGGRRRLAGPLTASEPGGSGERSALDETRLELNLPAAAGRQAAELLRTRGIGDRLFAVLAPGGRSSTRWPAASFAGLAVALAGELGLAVLIEGSPAETPLLREVEAGVAALASGGRAAPPAGKRGAILICQDPLDTLAALLARARLLIGNDSGPLHLAAALDVPALYFAQREKLVHSHPRARACWALFDDSANDPRRISVEQALGAVHAMFRQGVIDAAPN
ncbi:MAG TPA: glycosyltransferase family 9 protein [Thermoanaerobaculia bacterium]|nr:glycosyltransferase family 9 protein [Thermoanaerobaculia bacterium]